MTSRACLKCGHVAESEADLPDTCPLCGAVYARVEAALARGETIRRVAPSVIAARHEAEQELEYEEFVADERPTLLVSILISIGFIIAVFGSLAILAFFVMIGTVPGDGRGDEWKQGFELFVCNLAIGWAASAIVSLGVSLCRRPIAGIFWGLAFGIAAGLAAGLMFPELAVRLMRA